MINVARFWMCMYVSMVCISAMAQQSVPSAISRQLDSLQRIDDLSNWLYARIDYSYSKPKESLPFLMESDKKLWRKPHSKTEKEAWLMLLSNQGYNQLYAGNILESIDRYEKAYNYYVDQRLNIEDIAEYVLKPWANNYTRLGDYEKALFIQQKTLDYALKENNIPLCIAMYNNMAVSYRSMGNLRQAERYIMLGLESTDDPDPLIILLHNTLADIYREQNKLDEAERIITNNLSRQSKRPLTFETAYWLLSSYISAGDIQLAKKQYAGAERYYLLAGSLNDKYYQGNRLREKANIINQLGKVKLHQNQARAALLYFDQNLKSFGLLKPDQSVDVSKVFGDNRMIDLFYQKALAHRLLGQDERALENIQLALLSADKIRFELADVKTRQRFQSEAKQMAAKAAAIAFKRLEQTGNHRYAESILNIFEQTKARILLDDIFKNQQQLRLQVKDTLFDQKLDLERAIAYNERQLLLKESPDQTLSLRQSTRSLHFKLDYIEKQLQDKYPELKQPAITEATNPQALLAKLPADLHLIEFFAGDDVWYALEIKNRKVVHVKRMTNARLLKQRIIDFADTYYQRGPSAMINQPKEFFNASYTIYQSLLQGFDLRSGQKTVIVPDDVLGFLSFDGLITKKEYSHAISKWPFLIRSASLSYAFSIQTWHNQSQQKRRQQPLFSGLFMTHQRGSKQSIPAVKKEADAIQDIVSGTFLRNEDATAERFFRAFDQSSLLHISTHASLTGNQKEPTLAFEDDQVFLFELSARKHAPALVVLSACRTADGMMAGGEGIISLSRGFAAIGAQGTIAGLWNVNDDAAAAITAATYTQLLQKKEISAALRTAKLNWLQDKKSSEIEYLPYYWDALIFMGYDQQLELTPARTAMTKPFGIAVIFLLLTAAVWFVLRPRRPKEVNPTR